MWQWIQTNILDHEKILGATVFIVGLIFKEALQEFIHAMKVHVGFQSNLSLALGKDKKIDTIIDDLVADHHSIQSAVMGKITNGGGIPKEGSPIRTMIVNPVRIRPDWPAEEASPFMRNLIQTVYEKKQVQVTVAAFPPDEPTYAYLKSQKTEVTYIWVWLVKEKRKCRYTLSIRMSGTLEEGFNNMLLREDIRKAMNKIRKYME